MAGLWVPALDDDTDVLTAGLAYVEHGWYVGPASRGGKHPGSVLGTGWHQKTSRDPKQIAAWFAGTDYSLFLHCGRSGAVVFDVDDPDEMPAVLAKACAETSAPHQSTRTDRPGRGHFVFQVPPGRLLGNGTGKLGDNWGEVRGANGVIIVEPSSHEKAASGGRYRWLVTGDVPVLPESVATQLSDVSPASDAATDAAVAEFLDTHTEATRPTLLKAVTDTFSKWLRNGKSRHVAAVDATVWGLKEAAAGLYPARAVVEQIQTLFLAAVADARPGSSRAAGDPLAAAEYAGIVAWAVAQATASDPNQTRRNVSERTPENHDARTSGQPEEAAQDESPEPRRLKTTLASTVHTRRLRWLWDGRIVLGGLTLLAGREGLGKSTIAVDVTSMVTLGLLDGEFKGTPRSVVYVNSEDARDYTIVPRLQAAGADLDRVVFVDAISQDGQGGEFESPIVLPLDVDRLAAVVRQHDAAMVVLDAATSTIDSKLDGDRDRQMRQGLEGIARGVGEATGAGVLGIVHFGKRESADTGKLILGSIAWSQVARSVIAVARDDETDDLIVSTTKTNLGPGAPSLTARIVSATVATSEGDTSVGRVEWTGETSRDARDLLAVGEVDERSELDEARDWLSSYLEDDERAGSGVAGAIIKAAKRDGISERTLQRARKKMGIATSKKRDAWVWSLPAHPKASDGNAVTSEDVKAPQGAHVHDSRRLDALAPCEECQRTDRAVVNGFCKPCRLKLGMGGGAA